MRMLIKAVFGVALFVAPVLISTDLPSHPCLLLLLVLLFLHCLFPLDLGLVVAAAVAVLASIFSFNYFSD